MFSEADRAYKRRHIESRNLVSKIMSEVYEGYDENGVALTSDVNRRSLPTFFTAESLYQLLSEPQLEVLIQKIHDFRPPVEIIYGRGSSLKSDLWEALGIIETKIAEKKE